MLAPHSASSDNELVDNISNGWREAQLRIGLHVEFQDALEDMHGSLSHPKRRHMKRNEYKDKNNTTKKASSVR